MSYEFLSPPKAPLNFFDRYWPLQCPETIQAYILDFLDRDDLLQLKMISTGAQFFIIHKHMELSKARRLLKTFKTYKDLEPIQKLKLEFMKFNDRPVLHRIGITSGCIVLSPIILLYYSPAIIYFTYKRAVKPTIKFCYKNTVCPAYRFIKGVIKWICKNIIRPIFTCIGKCCVWIDMKIITPIIKAIIRFCKWINSSIIQPSINAGKKLRHFIYVNIMVPIGKAISYLLKKLWKGTVFVYDEFVYPCILVPIGQIIKFICKAVKFILKVIFHKILWNLILVPLYKGSKLVFVEAIMPVSRWIFVVLKGICVDIALNKLIIPAYKNIVAPVGRVCYNAIAFIGTNIVIPVGNVVASAGKLFYAVCIRPVGILFQTIGRIFK